MSADPRILARLDEAIGRVEAAERAAREPIAIVGIGCRFPGGADSPDAYWRLLRDGVDAVTEIPRERFDVDAYYDPEPGVPGKIYARAGAFVGAVDGFDAELFGIAPREAESLDPQQRLLVEVAWEALERSGQPWARHDGSATGVFVGVSNGDYGRLLAGGDLAAIGPYFLAGNLLSAMAGRIAYLLGLRGPALAVDTACSSSLVAVHLACHSLRSRECDLALAGGVSLMLSPETWVAGCHGRMLAPDGRSKTFAAAADGFGRGEGCGVVVLKRLSDAERDRDRIVAVIRGSAVNQDGASGGFSVPSGPAQQAVIRAALAQARIAPEAVSYVEAHGTGTALGDPIEMGALGAVYGRERARPLVVGSVKTNIGHLEAAAGVAGLIKAALAVEHGEIPAHLHFRAPNPLIAWERLAVEIPRERRAWDVDAPRVAGVSSFGFNGTNAHVVLSEPPGTGIAPAEAARAELLVLSARSDAALEALAARYAGTLADGGDDFADICATAAAGRRHFEHRLAVVAESRADALEKLRARRAGVWRGMASDRPRIAALFPGQGAQYAGMGAELLDAAGPVRDVVARCEAAIGDGLGWRLSAILRGEAGALEDTALAQPALYALECGLWELWRSWGVGVSAVLGHSVGEYAAAYAAGMLELEDGARLVATRGRLMSALCPRGVMAAAFAGVEAVTPAIGAGVAIAAENGPGVTVISGTADAVAAAERALGALGIASTRLAVSHAFHSALMDPMLAAYGEAVAAVKLRAPRLRFASTLTGALDGEAPAAPAYWVRQLRERVRFGAAVAALWAAGHRHYMEVGPGATLVGLGRAVAGAGPAVWVGGLRAGQPARASLLGALAQLHVSGVGIDWSALAPGRRKVLLPTYPFERRRHWIAPIGARRRASASTRGASPAHPLLGRRVRSALKHREALFESVLALDAPAYHRDHVVFGRALLPAASLVEMTLAAGAALLPGERIALEDLAIVRPLGLAPDAERTVQVVASPEADGGFRVEVSSLDAATPDGDWTLHATARIRSSADPAPPPVDLDALAARLDEADAGAFHRELRARGVAYGPAFQGLVALRRAPGEALGRICAPERIAAELPEYTLHPALLDACLQVVAGAMPSVAGDTRLQAGLARARVHGRAGLALWSHARLRESSADTTIADVTVCDDEGALVAELIGVVLRRAAGDAGVLHELCYEVAWEPLDAADGTSIPSLATVVRGVHATDDPPGDPMTGLLADMEAAAAELVVDALRRLGWDFAPGRRFTLEAIASELGVVSVHRRLLERLLAILAERGVVRELAGAWESAAEPAIGDPRRRLDALAARHRSARDEIAMLARCGASLPAVLRGEIEPLTLLFPEDDAVSAARLYLEASGARAMSRRVRDVVAGVVAGLGPDRRLRVLEIGGGTGGTTAAVLPALAAERTEYVFTDVSPWFTSRAAERFRAHPFVTYRRYDVERAPESQGLEAGRFDLVIAANVLHVVADLRATLASVSRLLAPGGILLVLEATRPLGWVDLVFGLTEGWWRFADRDVRPRHPLVSAATWERLLAESGAADVATVHVEREDVELLSRQTIVLGQRGHAPAAGDWLVFGDREVGPALVAALTRGGDRATLGDDPRELGGARARGIVWLRALDAADPADGEGLARGVGGALHLMQALVDADRPAAPAVWLVTRGAAGDDTTAGGVAQSALWGLARSAMAEHPDLGCRLVDLDPAWDAAAAADALAHALRAPAPSAEPLVALRRSGARVPRLVKRPAPAAGALALRADATYVITGGLGSVGLLTAERLVARGARALALLGRTSGSEAARRRVDALRAAGAVVETVAVDVSRADELERALAALAERLPAVRGVIHGAGVFDDRLVRDHRWALFEKVFAPKVLGAWNLHRLTRGMPLDFFVMSSSASVLFAPPGMSNYVAANTLLDALAHHRRGLGLPALSVDWGLWRGVGMATRFGAERERQWARLGMRPMEADEALLALEAALADPDGAPARAIMRVDWAAVTDPAPAGFFRAVRRASPRAVAVADGFRDYLRQAPPGERPGLLRAHVRQQVARVLGLPSAAAVDPRRGFFDAGMDSLTSLELRNGLQASLGCALPTTIALKYPSVDELAEFLRADVLAADLADAVPAVSGGDDGSRSLDAMTEAELGARLDATLDALERRMDAAG